MSEVRLIDATQLHRKLMDDAAYDFSKKLNLAQCLLYVENAPTIEAEPVRHGRWIDKGEYAVCTECDGRSGTQYDGLEPIALMTQFCQNCGAKMDMNESMFTDSFSQCDGCPDQVGNKCKSHSHGCEGGGHDNGRFD